MGLRFRKSIKLGGGARLNLSKSGIGYSWGVKGARFTKKANSGNRTTLSVPGTGISWVKDSKGKQSKKKTKSTNGNRNEYEPISKMEDIVEVEKVEEVETDRATDIKQALCWSAIILTLVGITEPVLLVPGVLLFFALFVYSRKIKQQDEDELN